MSVPMITKWRGQTDFALVNYADLLKETLMAQGHASNGWRYAVAEHHLYGSSRVGLHQTHLQLSERKPDLTVVYASISAHVAFYRGKRNYELSNHLGNVMATLSDKRRSVCNEELGIAFFEAEVLTQTDYYPFGAVMPDRQWSAGAEGYRYGYNGMERDDEIKGAGNSYFTEYRILDTRLGKWLSVDPAQQKFLGLSPYNALNNNPISLVDPNGLWHRKTEGKGADKREHLVANKGDNMESLEKYLNKRRNRNRFTDAQKDAIRKEVEDYGKTNNDVQGTQTPSYEGFNMNLSEKLKLSINIHVGRTMTVGPDADYKDLYYSKGGHVGVEIEGSVYNYFYEDPDSYDPSNLFALYPAKIRLESTMSYLYSPYGNGNHSYADGDEDNDGIPDIKGTDSYFTVYLTTGQYAKLRGTLTAYTANPTGVPQYGIFGKRSTSMANTMLKQSNILVVFMSSLRTFHTHQYYNALKKKGYAETVVR